MLTHNSKQTHDSSQGRHCLSSNISLSNLSLASELFRPSGGGCHPSRKSLTYTLHARVPEIAPYYTCACCKAFLLGAAASFENCLAVKTKGPGRHFDSKLTGGRMMLDTLSFRTANHSDRKRLSYIVRLGRYNKLSQSGRKVFKVCV